MLKQHCTLAKLASLSFLALCLDAHTAEGFTIISFDGYAARWNQTNPIQIEMDSNFTPSFSKAGCDGMGACTTPETAIQRSVDSWKNVSGINLNVGSVTTRTISGTPHYDGINQIKMYADQWESLPFAPPTTALAVTITTYGEHGDIKDADIFVNGLYFQWAAVDSTGEGSKHDVQNVITHELGHFFGLDHSSENSYEPNTNFYNATMFFASYPGETTRQTLEVDDINAIQHLYTADDFGSPTVDEITPNQIEVSYKQSVSVEIHGDNFLPTTSVVLARNTDDGDVVGRINSMDNGTITASFDVSNMKSGQYDVVVANSYNEYKRLTKAFTIQNNTVVGTYNSEAASGGGGCHSNGSSSLLLFLLPVLFVLPRRFQNQN